MTWDVIEVCLPEEMVFPAAYGGAPPPTGEVEQAGSSIKQQDAVFNTAL